MIIDVLQHVSFEGLAAIEEWGEEHKHTFRVHKLYKDATIPDTEEIDFLIVLGGPMSINDTKPAWIKEERILIKELILRNKPILGICLGAQQIAKTLGASIFKGDYKEVGWHTVNSVSDRFDFIPQTMTVFHWHGEQFELPKGAQLLFRSEVCLNQGFVFQDRIIGLQFHFESTETSVASILENDRDYLDDTPYVQTEEYIRSNPIPANNKKVLYAILNHLAESK